MYYLFLFALSLLIHPNFAQTYTCDTNATCGCSIASTLVTSRIVGGEIAPNHAWAWTVALLLSGSPMCGAVLISSEYALTAAHCVYQMSVSLFSIRAGTNYLYDQSSAAQIRAITGYYIHPNYNSTYHTYDIAVLHFSTLTSTNNSIIRYICLPAADVDPYSIGSNVVTVGWGTTSESSSSPSPYLRQVTVQVESPSAYCQQAGYSDGNLQLCAGANSKDACYGDSGSPLMGFVDNQWVLGGLTSTGYGCARTNYPGVYTRVSTLVSFIDYVIDSGSVTSESTTTTTTTTTTTAKSVSIAKSGTVSIVHTHYALNFLLYLILLVVFLSF